MIICVSIIDRHKPIGKQHVGTYTFEIDYPASEHPGQMDFFVVDCPPDQEHNVRPMIGVLHTLETMPEPVRVEQVNGVVTAYIPADNEDNPR